MTKADDQYWTQIAKEKEKQMAYDDKSPHMNHPMSEPIHHPNSVFDTLSALSDTVMRIDDLEQQKRKLISVYQEQMQAAEAGFSNILNRPEPAESPMQGNSETGFGNPRFGF